MKIIFKHLILIWILTSCFINALNCYQPEGCRLQTFYESSLYFNYHEKGHRKAMSMFCEINNDEFEFKFRDPNSIKNNETCDQDEKFFDRTNFIILKWTESNELAVLEKRFNFSNVIQFFRLYKKLVTLKIFNIKGFDRQWYKF